MRKILFLLLFLPLLGYTQVTDDFSDGDFTTNPAWSGTGMDTNFVVASETLQSDGPHWNLNTLGDTIYLATANTLISNTEWSFLIDLGFNPTADNVVRVYVVADSSDLRYGLNGYYIELGQTSADNIKFFKQTGTTSTLLFTGTTSFASNIKVKIKITRDSTGNWNIFSDPTYTGLNYSPEGASFNDTTVTATSFMGVYCRYKTDTRFNQYHFDDFYAGPIILDTISPAVQSVTLSQPMKLDVVFTEKMDETTAEDTNNYDVPGLGHPQSASRDSADFALVHLTYPAAFIQGVAYSLIISNVQDLSGNSVIPDTIPFSFYDGNTFDVVINEIMADPDPSVGLPNFEYLELFNRTQIPINLKNWNITIGSSIAILPEITILPGDFLILTGSAAEPYLSFYGACVGFSSFSLTNTGSALILRNKTGDIIHFVNYTDSWYQNTLKDEGGWALEQIDPANPCGQSANWRASTDPAGGTPGRINSVSASNPDLKTPLLIRASTSRKPADSNRVKIYFNEPLVDGLFMYDKTKYYVDNNIGNPDSVKLQSPENECIELVFAQAFQPGIIYTLTVRDSIFDCAGNQASVNQYVKFGIPALPDSGDLVINEVLADPFSGGADFVEIYNRSGKVLDFADLSLLSLTDSALITTENFLSLPGSYTLLTTNPDAVKTQYYTPNPYHFIDMASFPAMNNDGGTVILATNTDTIIDAMSYTDDMHFPLLNSTDGVSLERVSYDRPASDITNWHSAAESVGFATPAYQNSQFMANEGQNGSVSLEPELFSPDNDGYNDILNIICKSDTPGKMLNITIYDAKGRLIKYLIKNQLMSEQSVYSWDGTTDGNLKANIGIYIVYVEMLDMQGKVSHFKKTVVLATKL
ncbi:MAG TPA: lamin tail domain-containing protein [Bacteroidales bacterium]|nr:lamin tail domain-containing protein [Bacteroidales bacterium]